MKNKFIVILIFSFALLFALVILSFAHPGKTDEYGGHYDYEAGEYHYHHGYPAHQHPDGICPYNFDDQTDHSSGSSSYSNNEYKEYERQIEQEQQEYDEQIEKEKRQGAHAGELLGLDKGKETGYADGILNHERTLPSDYSPLFSTEYSYMDESLTYQLAFEQQFIESYEKAYDKAYDEGHKIWQEKHDKTVKTIVWSIIITALIIPFIYIAVSNHKKKKRLAEEKAKQEREFKLKQSFLQNKYGGKSWNEILDLPANIRFENGEFVAPTNENGINPLIVYSKRPIFYPYSYSGYKFHSTKECCKKYNFVAFETNITELFRYNENILCRNCRKKEHMEILQQEIPQWYIDYQEIKADCEKYKVELKDEK